MQLTRALYNMVVVVVKGRGGGGVGRGVMNNSPSVCLCQESRTWRWWVGCWRLKRGLQTSVIPGRTNFGSFEVWEHSIFKQLVITTLWRLGNYGVVYGSPCGRPEKFCLFILPWLALRRTGFSSEKNCCYSFLSSSKKNLSPTFKEHLTFG